VKYSSKDYEESEWFRIKTSESQYPEGKVDYCIDTYELSNWCEKCGVGAVQNRPFRLARDFQQKRDQFFGLHWVFDELFCRPAIIPILNEAEITGAAYLHPIYHKSGKTIDTTFQMKIDFVLAHGLFNDENAKYCPVCNRVKYLYPERNAISFSHKSFENVPDIVKSYEYFGSGGQAQRLVLASKKFYEVVKENKIHGLVFRPIKLVYD
jgi:hypothetical protein